MKLYVIIISALLFYRCASEIDTTKGKWKILRYEDKVLSSRVYSKELTKYSEPIQPLVEFDDRLSTIKIFPQKTIIVDSTTIKEDFLDRKPVVVVNEYFYRTEYGKTIRGVKRQSTLNKWSSIYNVEIFKNTTMVIIKNDGSTLTIKSDSNGSLYIDIRSIVIEPYTTDTLGILMIGEEKVRLIAPKSLSLFYYHSYRDNENWQALKHFAQSNSIIYSSVRDSAIDDYTHYALSLLKNMVLKKNYDQAIDYYDDLLKSNLHNDQMIEVMRFIPLNCFDSYSLVNRIFSTQRIYPLPEKETLVRFSGKVLQVIEDEGFLMEGMISVYCTVERINILDDLFDGRYISVIGKYKGTKTYITVMGSSRTIPWVEVVAKKIGY